MHSSLFIIESGAYYGLQYVLLISQERYQYLYLTRPSPEWNHSKLSQLCHVDTRLLLFNCLYEARNPVLYQSAAVAAGIMDRSPPLLHLDKTSMSTFDCLSLGYFLSWVCRTVSSETSVQLYQINDTCMKFLVNGLTEGIREANSCGDGSVGTLSIQLNHCTWDHNGLHNLFQLLQSSECHCISGLDLACSQLTHQDFLWIVKAVGSSKSLRVLSLRYPPHTKEGRLELCKMLHRNTTLKTFSITDDQMTKVITDIAEELKHNTILETVEFIGHISSIGLQLLAEVISHNKHLKTLSILNRSTIQHSADSIVLIKALKHNNTLQTFRLFAARLTVPQLQLLANVLTINTTLEKLEYTQFLSKAECTVLAKRLGASGVLHQLLTIALERTIERFGQQETAKALEKHCWVYLPILNYQL